MSNHEHGHHHGEEVATPTQILVAEHELILQALEALGKRLDRMGDDPTPADRVYLEEAVAFLRGFADKCHHGKEEDLLFKRMGERGFPTQGGPIAVMLSEHQAGRALIGGSQRGRPGSGRTPGCGGHPAQRPGRELLRNHIAKENQVLFPMADRTRRPRTSAISRAPSSVSRRRRRGPASTSGWSGCSRNCAPAPGSPLRKGETVKDNKVAKMINGERERTQDSRLLKN